MISPYIYAVFANMFWGLGAQFYAHYGRKFSSLWVNTLKAFFSGLCFLTVVLVCGGFHQISEGALGAFFLSGLLGLGIGDIFLIKAYSGMGPGRTMMLFSFQPMLVGVLSFFIFGQTVSPGKFISIIFFIICILIFSVETFKKEGHWNIKNTIFAFCGIFFDGVGILLTRYGFDHAPAITVFEGNLYRVIAALFFFFVVSRFIKFDFRKNFNSLRSSRKAYLVLGVFFGTFLALSFYLKAIQLGNLATVTAITVTGVIFAAVFESIFERKWPSKYLFIAFIFFAMGMRFLLF